MNSKKHNDKLSLVKWNELKILVFKRDNWTCCSCGKKVKLQVHHVKPKRNGGEDVIENLITLCAKCHVVVSPIPDSILIKVWRIKPEHIKVEKEKVSNRINRYMKSLTIRD